MVPGVELNNVYMYPISSMPSPLTHLRSFNETETMTTYTTVTTCPLTTSSGSAIYTTLTTSTIVLTSCKGGCHQTAPTAPPSPPKQTTSVGTAPNPPSPAKKTTLIGTAPPPSLPSVTSPPPHPSKGTSIVVSSVPPPPSQTPIYSNVCSIFGEFAENELKIGQTTMIETKTTTTPASSSSETTSYTTSTVFITTTTCPGKNDRVPAKDCLLT